MPSPQDVKLWIEQGLEDCSVDVTGDGRHFEAVIVCAQFDGKNMLEQHRLVYDALGGKMQEIHALSLRTLTSE